MQTRFPWDSSLSECDRIFDRSDPSPTCSRVCTLDKICLLARVPRSKRGVPRVAANPIHLLLPSYRIEHLFGCPIFTAIKINHARSRMLGSAPSCVLDLNVTLSCDPNRGNTSHQALIGAECNGNPVPTAKVHLHTLCRGEFWLSRF
jgi:hypothetical protein